MLGAGGSVRRSRPEWATPSIRGQAERIAGYGHMKYTQRTTNPDHIGATSADDGRTDTLKLLNATVTAQTRDAQPPRLHGRSWT